MLLQIVTIFKANEKQVKFDLPDNLNIFDYTVKPLHDHKVSEFQVSLKNITICGHATHSHIHTFEKFSYNEDKQDEIVHERYKLQIPKEPLGSRRRSTIYYQPNLDLEFVDNEMAQVRQRRGVDDEFIRIEAGFAIPFFTTSFRLDEEPAKECVQKINDLFIAKCNNHFGGLFRYPLALIQTELRNAVVLQLRIPPNSFFGFSDERMWTCLGFNVEGMSIPFTTFKWNNKTFIGIKNLTLVHKNLLNETYPTADLSLREFSNDPADDLAEVDVIFTLIVSKATTVSSVTPEHVSCIQDSFPAMLGQVVAKIYGSLILNTKYLPSFSKLPRLGGSIFHGVVVAARPGEANLDNFYIRFSGSSNTLNLVGISSRSTEWFPLAKAWAGDRLTIQTPTADVCPELETTEEGGTGVFHSVTDQYSFFEDFLSAATTSTPYAHVVVDDDNVIKQLGENLDKLIASTQDKHRQLHAYKEAARELPLLYSAYKDYKSVRQLNQLSTRISTQIDRLTLEIAAEVPPETYGDDLADLHQALIAAKAKQDASRKRIFTDMTTTDPAAFDTKRKKIPGEAEIVEEGESASEREAETVEEAPEREAETVEEREAETMEEGEAELAPEGEAEQEKEAETVEEAELALEGEAEQEREAETVEEPLYGEDLAGDVIRELNKPPKKEKKRGHLDMTTTDQTEEDRKRVKEDKREPEVEERGEQETTVDEPPDIIEETRKEQERTVDEPPDIIEETRKEQERTNDEPPDIIEEIIKERERIVDEPSDIIEERLREEQRQQDLLETQREDERIKKKLQDEIDAKAEDDRKKKIIQEALEAEDERKKKKKLQDEAKAEDDRKKKKLEDDLEAIRQQDLLKAENDRKRQDELDEAARLEREAKRQQDLLKAENERKKKLQDELEEAARLEREAKRQQDILKAEKQKEEIEEAERIKKKKADEPETVVEEREAVLVDEPPEEGESRHREESMEIDTEEEEEEEEEGYHTPTAAEPSVMDVETEETITETETEDTDIQELEFTRTHFKKPSTFYNMLNPKQGFCTPSSDFPSFSTILLHEGCKKDYNVEKGMCCILGFATKTGKAITITNITNNNCVITDFQVTSLSLEFLDPHHNTYKPQKDFYVSEMIQFDESSSKSIVHAPISHSSTHAKNPTKEVTSEEEEQRKEEELEPLQPGKEYIIYEDPLAKTHKKKNKNIRMEESNSDTDTSSSETTTASTSTSESEEQQSSEEEEKEKKKKKMSKTKLTETKKKKKIKVKVGAAAKKAKGTKKQNKKTAAIVQKTKKIFERALKELKKIK